VSATGFEAIYSVTIVVHWCQSNIPTVFAMGRQTQAYLCMITLVPVGASSFVVDEAKDSLELSVGGQVETAVGLAKEIESKSAMENEMTP
jgi:hypothetical protein